MGKENIVHIHIAVTKDGKEVDVYKSTVKKITPKAVFTAHGNRILKEDLMKPMISDPAFPAEPSDFVNYHNKVIGTIHAFEEDQAAATTKLTEAISAYLNNLVGLAQQMQGALQK